MDGTLLHPNGTLPKDFAQLFPILEERGIIFCVASGRQYNTLIKYFNQYKERMAFITENGAYITLYGEEIHQEYLDIPDITSILNQCKEISDIGVILCGKKGLILIHLMKIF